MITLSSFFLFIQLSYASDFNFCFKDNIQTYITSDEIKTNELEFCTNKNATIILSKNCIDKKCVIYEKLPNLFLNIKLKNSRFGNPGYNLCRQLKGQPATIHFFSLSKKEVILDWCYFKADKSFIDNGSLYEFYRESLK